MRERVARRLALAAGEPDFERTWQLLTPEQMDGWIAFDELEGVGMNKVIEVLARVGSLVCMALGYDIPDARFIPGSEDDACDPPQPVEAQIAAARSIAAAAGGG